MYIYIYTYNILLYLTGSLFVCLFVREPLQQFASDRRQFAKCRSINDFVKHIQELEKYPKLAETYRECVCVEEIDSQWVSFRRIETEATITSSIICGSRESVMQAPQHIYALMLVQLVLT